KLKAAAVKKSTVAIRSPIRFKAAKRPTPAEMQAAAERNKRNTDREHRAPPKLTAAVSAVRSSLAARHAAFHVGVTGVSHEDLDKLTGVKVNPPDLKAVAALRARRGQQAKRANLVRLSMFARATPPPKLLAAKQARMNPEDVRVAAPPTASTGQGG